MSSSTSGSSSRRRSTSRFGLDHVDLGVYRVDPDAAKLVTPAAARRYQAVPVSFAGERTLMVAMSDPANVLAQDDIAVMTGWGSLVGDEYPALFGGLYPNMPKDSGAIVVFTLPDAR